MYVRFEIWYAANKASAKYFPLRQDRHTIALCTEEKDREAAMLVSVLSGLIHRV